MSLEIPGVQILPAQDIHKYRKFEYVEKRFGLKVTSSDKSAEQETALKEMFGKTF